MDIKKIKLAFVILHYRNTKDTIECIDSIKKSLKSKDYKIVVVDNNSGNDNDSDMLKKKVDDLIVSNENLGFAKGNNLGIDLAKEKYNPEFIAAINNDTLIEQTSLIEDIEKIYKEVPFDVLGFKILTNNGYSVNPFPSYKTLDEVEKAINKSNRLINIYESPIKRKLLKFYLKMKHTIKDVNYPSNGSCRMEDVSLHGCALIFSKKYLRKYDDAFYKGTFIYHEEEFLEYRRKKDNLKFVYDPSIVIFHKEGSSLNYNYSENYYKKLIFREQNVIKSLTLLKQIMEENKKI